MATSTDKPIYFISDLHLSEQQPASNNLFHRFMHNQASQAQAVFILGDLFDYWIGDDDRSLFYDKVMQALRDTHKLGVKLYFMPGNRDFLIGNWFLEQTGMQRLPDPYVFIHQHQRILLTHGDLLCRQDKRHLLFRRITQSTWGKQLLLSRPLPKRRKLALRTRRLSRGNASYTTDPVSAGYTSKLMHQHQAKQLVHGHTHQAAIHHHSGSHRYTRIVLSDWHDQATIATLDEDCQIQHLCIE